MEFVLGRIVNNKPEFLGSFSETKEKALEKAGRLWLEPSDKVKMYGVEPVKWELKTSWRSVDNIDNNKYIFIYTSINNGKKQYNTLFKVSRYDVEQKIISIKEYFQLETKVYVIKEEYVYDSVLLNI